ncbi:hypothetical protein M0P48_03950 [Candidatus Gracilibacteria bacterium]|nr:hypothetical protein [Candidatus Gracilibacteria bacterium]
MKKFLALSFVVFPALFFVACSAAQNVDGSDEVVKSVDLLTDWRKTQFYKIEDKDLNKVFYFEFPDSAKVSFIRGRGDLNYQNCHVSFGTRDRLKSTIQTQENDDKKTKAEAGRVFESVYRNDVLAVYSADLRTFGYAFWLYDEGKDISECTKFLNKIAYSFTDKPMYMSEKYGFSVVLPTQYKVEYLADDSGVLFKGWSKGDDFDLKKNKAAKNELGGYGYDIKFEAYENVMKYTSLSDLLKKKYDGFSKQFYDLNGKTGVFVDENLNASRAIRHFFVFSPDSSVIYEASLDIESFHYFAHGQEFDDFVKTSLAIY